MRALKRHVALGMAFALLALALSVHIDFKKPAPVTLHAWSAEAYPAHRRFMQRNLSGPAASSGYVSDNFIDFAPADGTGMGLPCACAAITSAQGDHLEFQRLGSAYCTKTATSMVSGIAAGDVVLCEANQPRVMAGNDPSGVLGLLVEAPGSNKVTQPFNFLHADWTPYGVGVAAPTITANACTAPDGTMTGYRFQFPAVTASEESAIFIALSDENDPTFSKNSQSTYVRSNSGTRDFGLNNYSGVWQAVVASVVSTSWTRVLNQNVTSAGYMLFGNSGVKSGQAFAASDLCVWGAQSEQGLSATSLMATTRAGEAAYIPLTDCVPTVGRESYCPNGASPDYAYTPRNAPANPYSVLAWTAVTPNSMIRSGQLVAYLEATPDSSNGAFIEVVTGKLVADYNFHGDGNQTVTSAAAVAVNSVVDMSIVYDGTQRKACIGAVCATTAGAINVTLQEAVAINIGGGGFYYTGSQTTGNCPGQSGNCGIFGDGNDAANTITKKLRLTPSGTP